MTSAEKSTDKHLHMMWRDSAWIPMLNTSNILEYFANSPFYDRECNNEMIKMQRLNPDQLLNMTGIEYFLLHTQAPILYVIRKGNRQSPTHINTICDYYIINGSVYQAPDLCSIVNSRLLNTTHNLLSAFEEVKSYSRYHPSAGYWWQFKNESNQSFKKKLTKNNDPVGSYFQRQKVDALLKEHAKKYPIKIRSQNENIPNDAGQNDKKNQEHPKSQTTDPSMPPPGKKPKIAH